MGILKLRLALLLLLSSRIAIAASITGISHLGVEIGESSVSALEKLENYQADFTRGNGNQCFYLSPINDQPGAWFMIINHVVVRIDINSENSQVAMGNGLGVGSTKQEVLSSYQNVEVSPHPYISPMGEYLKIVLPNGNGIIFETNSAIVTRFRIGSFPAVEYIEGCL